MTERLGFSGSVAKKFLQTELTPLLALLGLLLGLFAVMVTPREEEPQIDVTFANVFIPFPGASAQEVEQLVTTSAEQVLSEIEGVKHIYSVSRPGLAVLTVEFQVGEARTEAIVRLYNTLYSNRDWLPAGLGVGQPLVKPKGIDDVPIVTVTLWTDDETRAASELRRVAHAVEAELKRVPGTRDIYTIGGPTPVVHILLDPQRLAGFALSLSDVRGALQQANQSSEAGELVWTTARSGSRRVSCSAMSRKSATSSSDCMPVDPSICATWLRFDAHRINRNSTSGLARGRQPSRRLR
jgi:multidrug efflux pump subunit AcrB